MTTKAAIERLRRRRDWLVARGAVRAHHGKATSWDDLEAKALDVAIACMEAVRESSEKRMIPQRAAKQEGIRNGM